MNWDWRTTLDVIKEFVLVWGVIIGALIGWALLPPFWSIAAPAFAVGVVAGIIGKEIYDTDYDGNKRP